MGPPAQPNSTPMKHNPPPRSAASPVRRPTSPTHSVRSNASRISTEARVKLAQYEAEKELAELEEQRLRMKEKLVKSRLAAEMSAIEAESQYAASERVQDWVNKSAEEPRPCTSRFREEPQDARPPINEQWGESTKQKGIQQLANVLERMVTTRPPPRQTTELPIFTGAVSEWLPFKATMEDSTRLHKFSPTENLLRLRNSLRGEARETVLSQLFTAGSPDIIMRTLEMKYGRPEYIIDKAMDDLKKLPKVGYAGTELYDFAVKIQNIVYTIKSVDRRGYLQNPMLVREVVEKLSPHLITKWAEYAAANERSIALDNEMTVLSEFLINEADLMLRYAHTRRVTSVPAKKEATTRRVVTRGVYTAETTAEERKCLMCQSGEHYAPDCHKLKQMDINERWQWAKENKLCFKCLKKKHNRFMCKAKACGVHGCTYQHHALLHKDKPKQSTHMISSTNVEEDDAAAVMSVTAEKTPCSILLKTCRVKLSGPRGELVTDALLDEGSTVTLIDEELANQLTNGGPSQPLNIRGINEQKKIDSKAVKIGIKGLHEQEAYEITARTIQGLELHTQRIPRNLHRYSHLRKVANKIYAGETKPRILIGADNWHLIVSRQLTSGKKSEPAASWTKLGWVLHGSTPRKLILEDQAAVLHICDVQLHRLVESHFNVDSLGVSTKQRVNKLDKRVEEIFETTAQRKNGHFEVGLPWKTDDPQLPESYESALKRLCTLERKMNKDSDFKQEYKAQVENLIRKGYATECDGSEEHSKIKWYLPHFAVTNPNKPGKIRMVFDAAARAHGVSLNDFLLEGPDLLASLTKILFGFREKPIAVTADIEEMFLRVKIRPEDQPAQMFLWRDESSSEPKKMKMTSMIFGASSSPFLAHSVRNRNAADYENLYPEAATAIKERHYMDDYLDSYATVEEARKTIKEVNYIHEQASFNLRGWNCNNKDVLASIPEEKRSQNTKVKLATHQKEKTLGLRWDPNVDTLTFNTDTKRVPNEVKLSLRAPTKRETLSAVMSIYDPLGLISQYTITGKIILQQLWLKKIDWDEQLPSEEANLFGEWIRRLSDISAITIPRCYSLHATPEARIELHIFTDASEQAYAAAAYWRIEYDEKVETIQVMAKAKVAPLKIVTIPRLELQAALLGARLANTVVREHSWKARRIIYWSDSKTVLHWIRNDRKKYTPFVAHRLAEIAELTQAEDWRWVPTTLNVADDATRLRTGKFDSQDRWFTGPSFLRTSEDSWPTEDEGIVATQEETCYVVTDTDSDDALPDVRRFSNYNKLIRTTALIHLFIEKTKTKNKTLTLSVRHIEAAELRWVRHSQHESFKEDVARLKHRQPLLRQSKLRKLDPVMMNGVIRARGRIGAFNLSTHSNEPAILDGRHPFVRLLIDNHHRRAGHANNERVVNELRQSFIILHLRPIVKQVARNCQFCRVYKATPKTPPKGNLPKGRLDPRHRAFTYCGVDYFGPLVVTIGRRHEKRWCALFTCLTTRAIHLELVQSLSTDSAIMALRRMAARRGWPRVIYSDNATNFRGADLELRRAYEKWTPELRDFSLQYRTDWRFIAPGAPHMGGVWERLVRSVKVALSTTLREKAPKEEVLQTLITEAEYSVNARPLTHVSVDPSDNEALTPNHFLIGSSTGLPATGPCEESERSMWRRTQALADKFWQRWIQEYLPTLIPRGQAGVEVNPIRQGDLVVVVDPTLPRNTWPRGVVERVYPGPDGIIRSADVRTKGGVFRRPTTKLAVLQVEEAATRLRRGEDVTDGFD